MSEAKPTRKNYLYIDRNGGLALDMAGFLLDPVVQKRIKQLDDIDIDDIDKETASRKKSSSAKKSNKKKMAKRPAQRR